MNDPLVLDLDLEPEGRRGLTACVLIISIRVSVYRRWTEVHNNNNSVISPILACSSLNHVQWYIDNNIKVLFVGLCVITCDLIVFAELNLETYRKTVFNYFFIYCTRWVKQVFSEGISFSRFRFHGWHPVDENKRPWFRSQKKGENRLTVVALVSNTITLTSARNEDWLQSYNTLTHNRFNSSLVQICDSKTKKTTSTAQFLHPRKLKSTIWHARRKYPFYNSGPLILLETAYFTSKPILLTKNIDKKSQK